jgi:hypothetical protein
MPCAPKWEQHEKRGREGESMKVKLSLCLEVSCELVWGGYGKRPSFPVFNIARWFSTSGSVLIQIREESFTFTHKFVSNYKNISVLVLLHVREPKVFSGKDVSFS